ncbi:Eco57I restriction-modification methylase domain-containing protein (plasmid) [Haladaptatus sp. SPP-AMP-3]|uniref:Eco57I restriction-modification methylase domain-containing protein n=1 Tax=Haladaptatus sp. SPP-AMP-3 TaxID=3121295 RepID=UPI003C2BA202
MCDDRTRVVRRHLDDGLSIGTFERESRPTEEAATRFFRTLFVQVLDFEATPSSPGETPWGDLPVSDWSRESRAMAARVFAKAGPFRVVYVELEELTRTAERSVVRDIADSDLSGAWGGSGSFVAVFHAPGADVWHLVTPYEDGIGDITTGRPALRRHVLGAGETHRTVASALGGLNATADDLDDRIHDAFRLEPVTRRFHEGYTEMFDTLRTELREKGVAETAADRSAHLTLNRLSLLYFLQKTGRLGGRTDFLPWFLRQYERSDDVDCFHEKWLSALFGRVDQPDGTPTDTTASNDTAVSDSTALFDSSALSDSAPFPNSSAFPGPVADALSERPELDGGIFRPDVVETNGAFLSDATLRSVVRDFFEGYSFTLAEERPDDIDIAVSPRILGTIYESFIAERERGEAGIFYTPRTEVDLLCRMALYEQFRDRLDIDEADAERRLVGFVFGDPIDWNPEPADPTDELESVLRSLDIVDPACGGGAFLVGMTEILTELYRKLGYAGTYGLKKRVLSENVSGVDIKPWAVHVAEMRLWLSLLRSEDGCPTDTHPGDTHPDAPRPDEQSLFPDLSFDLLVGDTLVQNASADEHLPFEQLRHCADEGDDTGGKLEGERREFVNRKTRFFEGELDDPTLVEAQRTNLVLAALERAIDRQSASSTGTPTTLDGLERLRERVESDDRDGFVWELDFPAVMTTGGFDIVIGNPPYVRHENITPPTAHQSGPDATTDTTTTATAATATDAFRTDASRESKSAYKRALGEFVERRFDIAPYKTSDLYLYFYFRSMDVLREGGTLSFVTSNAWLDVDYGVRLQEFLLSEGDVRYLFESRARRTFEEADVNTALSVVNRNSSDRLSNDVEFVAAYTGYDRFVSGDVLEPVLVGSGTGTSLPFRGERLTLKTGDGWRSIGVPEPTLWRLGGASMTTDEDDGSVRPRGDYRSGKWGKYTRAPTVFFDIVGNADPELVPLGSHCAVQRGTRTGANQFFYLPSDYYDARPEGDSLVLTATGEWPDGGYATELEIPRSYWMHETADGWEPNLVLKTPKSFETPMFDPESLEPGRGLRYVLRIDEPRDELDGDVAEYVRWGEEYDPSRDDIGRKRTPFPSSVSGRGVEWYDLTEDLQRGDVLPMKNIDRRHAYWFPTQQPWIDNRLHGIEVPGGERNRRFVAGLLNSTYGALAAEVNGRVNLGQGALDIATDDHGRTPIPRLDVVDERLKADIATRFEQLGARPIASIFDELGTSNPESVSFERVAPDRLELDRLVVRDLLGLDEEVQLDLYRGVLKLTRQRVEKADSV